MTYTNGSANSDSMTPEEVDAYLIRDRRIAEGQCANGCGEMRPISFGQECPQCGFCTNALPTARPH